MNENFTDFIVIILLLFLGTHSKQVILQCIFYRQCKHDIWIAGKFISSNGAVHRVDLSTIPWTRFEYKPKINFNAAGIPTRILNPNEKFIVLPATTEIKNLSREREMLLESGILGTWRLSTRNLVLNEC